MSAPTQSSFDDFDFEKVSGTASNNGWSPDSGDNKGLYDNGDTGTSLFPEFKPRGFTKSEPMQRRTLKTVLFTRTSLNSIDLVFFLFFGI